jgi:nucleoside-diphosphate-sugar epimerase
MTIHNIIVLGATSLIGHYLIPQLKQQGLKVQVLSRKQPSQPLQPADCLISLAPLWILPDLIPQAAAMGVKRVIAFSSTSRFSKQASPEPSELALAEQLASAEDAMALVCQKANIDWTILRPTLIYGDITPENPFLAGKALSTILQIIRRLHCFPIVDQAPGLRQPVHAEDLANACLAVLNNPAAYNKAYNLSGGETLSYRQMIERIFYTLGKKPYLIPIPLVLLRAALKGMRFLPNYRFLTPEMANRTHQNLCFDHTEAIQDFEYQPRSFFRL